MKRLMMILVLPWSLLHEVLHLLAIIASSKQGTCTMRMFWTPTLGFNAEVYKHGSNPFIMDVLSCIAPIIINIGGAMLGTIALHAGHYISAAYWYLISVECGISKQDRKQLKELWYGKDIE